MINVMMIRIWREKSANNDNDGSMITMMMIMVLIMIQVEELEEQLRMIGENMKSLEVKN